jgi:hypothetical protein
MPSKTRKLLTKKSKKLNIKLERHKKQASFRVATLFLEGAKSPA